MATEAEHRERVDVAGGRWLEAAQAYAIAWRRTHPDGVPSVRQQQTSEGERLARTGYERALADYRRHLRGESHDE
jgi:hypothetical protein